MKRLVAIDPGKNIGIATFHDTKLVTKFVTDASGLFDYLTTGVLPDVLVYEDYRLDNRAARQRGSDVPAAQVIGALRFYQHRYPSMPMLKQSNTILPVVAMHFGQTAYRGHYPDDVAAMLHGAYALENAGVPRKDILLS